MCEALDMSVPFCEEIDVFLDYMRAERGASAETLRAYGGDLRRFEAWFTERASNGSVSSVRVHHLRAYLAERVDECSPATVSRVLATLRSFFRFSVRRRGLASDPAQLLVTPRVPKPLRGLLSVDETFVLLDQPVSGSPLELRNRAMWELLYSSGLRVSELVGLDLRAIDLEEAWVSVIGKGGKARQVPVGSAAVTALRRYLRRRPELDRQGESALFLNHRGGRLTTRSVRRLLETEAASCWPRSARQPARTTALVCDSSTGCWSGPAHDPGAAWSQQPLDDAALYPPVCGPSDGGLRSLPPTGAPSEAPSDRNAQFGTRGLARRARLPAREAVSSIRWPDAGFSEAPMFKGTTILALRDAQTVVVAGDGQVSLGNTVVKATARKVRRLSDGAVIAGFAGSTADAMTLFEKLEGKLKQYNGKLLRASVELAKEWRTDRYLRRLEAMLIAANRDLTLMLSGTGDVIEPDEGVAAIGSGSGYALAAARALKRNTDMGAEAVVSKAMAIAAEICVFTNDCLVVERIDLEA